jgi:hypothetical protein
MAWNERMTSELKMSGLPRFCKPGISERGGLRGDSIRATVENNPEAITLGCLLRDNIY